VTAEAPERRVTEVRWYATDLHVVRFGTHEVSYELTLGEALDLALCELQRRLDIPNIMEFGHRLGVIVPPQLRDGDQ
jgi:hypothetical protein